MERKLSKALAMFSLALILTFNIGVVYGASSGESEGTAQVTSAVPTISSPELWDSTETTNKNNTALTVNTEYHVNFTISDANTMADLKNVTIRIWLTTYSTENGTDAERNHYSFTWVESTDTWSSSPSGFINTANCKDPGTGGTSTSYEFTLAFDLSKVANYTASTTDWKISIFVWDDADNGDSEKTLFFGVAFYSEISITDTTHQWSGLLPGDTDKTVDGDGDIDFTVIANSKWDAQAKANQSNLVSGSNTIGVGNITIHKDTLASSVSLTTSWADIGGLTVQDPPTTESSPISTYCTLWLDVPSGTPVGNYVYKLQLQIIQG
jgi:hypothetical protein